MVPWEPIACALARPLLSEGGELRAASLFRPGTVTAIVEGLDWWRECRAEKPREEAVPTNAPATDARLR